MLRRTTLITALLATLGGAVLAATPAHAADLTPVALAPCPLTETQLANGRQLVFEANRTVDRGAAVLGSSYSRPTMTPITNPAGGVSSVSDCLTALNDLRKKVQDAEIAAAQWAACVAGSLGGSGCGPELDNYEAALHAVEVALNNLHRLCPWVLF
jgi:hypothetical protein